MSRPLLPGEYAVLGLLSLRPMHGYDMARHFATGELAEVCPLEQPSLYTYIRNVEARGLVAWREERVGARPPRKLLDLTPAGHEALESWLRAPVTRLREVRMDFLLKLYFLRQSDLAGEAALLDAQITACEGYLAEIEHREPANDFQALVAGSRRSAARATIDWLVAYRDSRREVAARP